MSPGSTSAPRTTAPGTTAAGTRRSELLRTPRPRPEAGLALVVVLGALGTSSTAVALPSIAASLRAGPSSVQWVVTAHLVAVAVAVVPVGRLGDRWGRRRVLSWGTALYAAASLAGAASPGLGALVLARALQGVGGAAMMALAVALARDAVPADRLGRSVGLLGSASAVGTALGPSLGGVLTQALGWRSVLAVGGPAGVAALALLLAGTLPSRPSPRGERTAPVDRAREADDARWVDGARAALACGAAMTCLVAAVMMTTLVAGPFYLSRALGASAAGVGLLVSVGPALAAVSGVPAGRLVDRIGAPRGVVVGLVGMLLGCTGLALVPVGAGGAGYAAGLAVLTPGYALFQAACTTAVLTGAAASARGTASAALTLARSTGLALGSSLAGALLAAAVDGAPAAGEQAGAVARGAHTAFAVAAGLVVLALATASVLAVVSRRRRPARSPGPRERS